MTNHIDSPLSNEKVTNEPAAVNKISSQDRFKKVLPVGALNSRVIKSSFKYVDSHPTSDTADYSMAVKRYEDSIRNTREANGRIDAKALEIIKFMGGGTGIIAIGTTLQINDKNWMIALSLLVSMAFAIAAIFFADTVRRCSARLIGPSPRWYAKMAEKFTKQEIEQTAVKELDVAMAAESLVNMQKTTTLGLAQRIAFFAICSLMLPVIVGVISNARPTHAAIAPTAVVK